MPAGTPPGASDPSTPSPPGKSRRRTSSLALGLLALNKSKDPPPETMPPLRPMRDPRRSMTADLHQHAHQHAHGPGAPGGAGAHVPAVPLPLTVVALAQQERKSRPSTADGEGPIQLRPSRSSHSSSQRDSAFMKRNGVRCAPAALPYPRNYDRAVLDHDVWENEFFRELCGSVTWHDFKTPPKKVLDLGCGTGTWVMDCARLWKESRFVGLDIVPLQPDLHLLGSDIAPRVKWVQANFLERLPFDDEEFDFVHVRRIARGVPETKWDYLLEEITRVLKKGGAFEIVEEDLIFPGSADFPMPQDLASPAVAGPSRVARPDTASSSKRLSTSSIATTSNGNAHGKPLVNPHDHSELESIYNGMHSDRWINLEVLSLLNSMLVMHFVDVRSHAPVHVAFPPYTAIKPTRSETTSKSDSTKGDTAPSSPVTTRRELSRSRSGRIAPARAEVVPEPNVASAVPPRLRAASVSKTPPVNVAPTASTSTAAAPPPPFPPPSYGSAHVTVSPTATSPVQPPSSNTSSPKPTAPKLAIPVSPASNSTPSSPFATQPYPTMGGPGSKLARAHTLPNTTWNFDPGTLPLHLSLRVSEVRACMEAMWDWMVANGKGTDDPIGVRPPTNVPVMPDELGLPHGAQGTKRWSDRHGGGTFASLGSSVVVGAWAGISNPAKDGAAPSSMHLSSSASVSAAVSAASSGSGASSAPAPVGPPGEMTREMPAIYTPRGQARLMTRAELERLVDRFEMDMHDHISLATSLASRLNWQAPKDHPPPAERKAFDESVALWEDYIQQQAAARRNAQDPTKSQIPVPVPPSPLKLSRTLRAFVAWKAS
ncbi:hypothetical protein AURDEDRAFT_113983 [Auricularia subglabra TFB-10046 SS5]|nr:hypothetical protein AURDEDRAFT_113983 [Auricularia subglabra TFB-10046 SS5]